MLATETYTFVVSSHIKTIRRVIFLMRHSRRKAKENLSGSRKRVEGRRFSSLRTFVPEDASYSPFWNVSDAERLQKFDVNV